MEFAHTKSHTIHFLFPWPNPFTPPPNNHHHHRPKRIRELIGNRLWWCQRLMVIIYYPHQDKPAEDETLTSLIPQTVIGKALILNEIINDIQSLEQQVEFLSMKLEAVTSRSHPSPQVFPSKDFGQQIFDMAGVSFGSQPTREFSTESSPEWLHMQIGGSFERTT